MPIYNEEESIQKTFYEWQEELKLQNYFSSYTFLFINDGSIDDTLNILKSIKIKFSNIEIIDKENSGHGQSCLVGYNYALNNSYDYILQLDSDGQCDPKYLNKFIVGLSKSDVVYGIRYYRKDGIFRFWVSRFLSLVALFVTGIWSWDPNVPYRMFRVNSIYNFLNLDIKAISLVNVILALYHKKYNPLLIPIVFRDRHGGSPSVNTSKLFEHGITFYKQLKKIVKHNDLG